MGGDGIERWVAYPVVLWLILFGGYLMGGSAARCAGKTARQTDAIP